MKPRVVGLRPTGKITGAPGRGAAQLGAPAGPHDRFYCRRLARATSDTRTPAITANALDNVADGWPPDPARSTLFVQSLVPEHAELHLLLSMTTRSRGSMGADLQGAARAAGRGPSTIGFLGYRLLQTADVAIYDAEFVPVGEDQVPHLELSREVVRRYNNFYGERLGVKDGEPIIKPVLREPQPLLTTVPRLPGLDNRKMSKSYGNAIDLSDTAEDVRKKVMSMYTDPKRVRADIPGTVEGNPVFIYHDAFNSNLEEVEDLKARYRLGKVGDVEVKKKLIAAVNGVLEPMRQRRAEVLARPGYVREVLFEGSRRARALAQETMACVREAMKITH